MKESYIEFVNVLAEHFDPENVRAMQSNDKRYAKMKRKITSDTSRMGMRLAIEASEEVLDAYIEYREYVQSEKPDDMKVLYHMGNILRCMRQDTQHGPIRSVEDMLSTFLVSG